MVSQWFPTVLRFPTGFYRVIWRFRPLLIDFLLDAENQNNAALDSWPTMDDLSQTEDLIYDTLFRLKSSFATHAMACKWLLKKKHCTAFTQPGIQLKPKTCKNLRARETTRRSLHHQSDPRPIESTLQCMASARRQRVPTDPQIVELLQALEKTWKVALKREYRKVVLRLMKRLHAPVSTRG